MLCLQDLPNEIFLNGIFQYFSLEELYYTFFNLNTRMNNILRSLSHLKFTVNQSTFDDPKLLFFAPSIMCLKVHIGQFDIQPFHKLRRLEIEYPGLQQRNSIRSKNFPFLKYLKLSYPLNDEELLNSIFSNDFQNLKVCCFDRTRTDHRWIGSQTLRSVSISVHGAYGIVCVLRACPNIFTLNIIVYSEPEFDIARLNYPIQCMNMSLQRLFIRSELKMLATILKATPNLIWLKYEPNKCHPTLEDLHPIRFQLVPELHTLKSLSFILLKIDVNARAPVSMIKSWHPLFRHITTYCHLLIISSFAISEGDII